MKSKGEAGFENYPRQSTLLENLITCTIKVRAALIIQWGFAQAADPTNRGNRGNKEITKFIRFSHFCADVRLNIAVLGVSHVFLKK